MRINALIQLKQPRLRHWNIKQNCLLIIRGTEDFKRLPVAGVDRGTSGSPDVEWQIIGSALDRTSIAKLFREAELAATTWVDSFLQSRLEDTTPNNEYLRSMPLTSNLLTGRFSQKQFSKLPGLNHA